MKLYEKGVRILCFILASASGICLAPIGFRFFEGLNKLAYTLSYWFEKAAEVSH